MILKGISAFPLALLMSSFSDNHKESEAHSIALGPKPSQLSPDIELESISYSASNFSKRMQTECKMSDSMERSVLFAAQSNNLKTNDSANHQPTLKNARITVDFIDVISHHWRSKAIRPGSVATFTATLHQNNEPPQMITKSIASYMTMGTCDRLENIAYNAGQFLTQWTAAKI